MTSKITESTIETFAIELLKKHGYQYIYSPDIAPNSDVPVPRGQTLPFRGWGTAAEDFSVVQGGKIK